MLVRSLELEVGFEVHLGSLLEQVSCNQTLHVEPLSLLLLLFLALKCLLALLLEVFKFELFFLEEGAVIESDSDLVITRVRLFEDVTVDEAWVTCLRLELCHIVSLLEKIDIIVSPLLMLGMEPGVLRLFDSLFSSSE